MRKKSIYFLVIIWLVFLSSEGASALRELQEGMEIPPFSLKRLDGKQLSYAELKGAKGALIVFWQTSTKNSLKALDALAKEAKKWQTKGLEIIALNVEGMQITPEEMDKLRNLEKRYPFPFYVDEGLVVFDKLGVIALPTFILVNERNIIQREMSGFPLVGVVSFFEEVASFLGETKKETPREQYRPAKKALLLYQLGLNQEKRGNLEVAQTNYEKSILTDRKYINPYLRLLDILLAEKKLEKAKTLLTGADPELKKKPLYGLMTGILAYHEGDFKRAAELIKESLKYEETPNGYLYLGFISFQEGKIPEGEVNFEQAVEISSGDPKILYQIGKFLISQRKNDKARNYYRRALEEILKSGNK